MCVESKCLFFPQAFFLFILDRYQCLLPLTTTPIVVHYGTGASYKEAQIEAAKNALCYLKLMTKKSPPSIYDNKSSTNE